MKRFEKLADEPPAVIPKDAVMELSLKTTRERRREQRDFMRDRLGHSGSGRPSRTTYMAHGNGWVLVRHPGCIPFAVMEREWQSFPYYSPPND